MYSDNAKRVLAARYYRNDESRPEQLFWRVANYIATAEEQDREHWAGEFYELMANLEFLPNTPCLMNAGTDIKNLSACFVLEIPDSMEGIFDTLKHTALIFKGGGGVGLYLGNLRPAGDSISTIKPSGTLRNIGIASGPISFAEIFDVATEKIKQGGVRKGALMGVLPCWHPDVLSFIECKRSLNKLQNFNISVSITDQFMEAVKCGGLTPIINPRSKQVIDRVPARPIMDKLVENAHATGEPGIIFIDRINAASAIPSEPINAVNPCSELPLNHMDACNLGSVNLMSCITKLADNRTIIDYIKLDKIVRVAVRFLDNVVTLGEFPIPQIKQQVVGARRIGLGIMGWADVLASLEIPYGNPESLQLAETVMSAINESAHTASVFLAGVRGNFPKWGGSIWAKHTVPRRNATTTCIAPTGSLSIIADCTGGIEPIFELAFTRNLTVGTMKYINPILKQKAAEYGFTHLLDQIVEHRSLDIEGIPDHIRNAFRTSRQVTPEQHIQMLAAFQKHTENAVSKTVNLPANAGIRDVEEAFMLAYELKCKGVTVYRDGCRENQPMQ